MQQSFLANKRAKYKVLFISALPLTHWPLIVHGRTKVSGSERFMVFISKLLINLKTGN